MANWYYKNSENERGPFEEVVLSQEVAAGRVTAVTRTVRFQVHAVHHEHLDFGHLDNRGGRRAFGYAISVLSGLNTMRESVTWGLLSILFATVAVVVGLIISRMAMEVTIILFRIETHLRTLRDQSLK